MTNHLGKNKIIAPKELNSCPRGFAAWARMISYGAIILFLPSWLVTNSILESGYKFTKVDKMENKTTNSETKKRSCYERLIIAP